VVCWLGQKLPTRLAYPMQSKAHRHSTRVLVPIDVDNPCDFGHDGEFASRAISAAHRTRRLKRILKPRGVRQSSRSRCAQMVRFSEIRRCKSGDQGSGA